MGGVGGGTSGGWFSKVEFSEIARQVGIAMAISVVIGLLGIALGLRIRHMKRGANGDRPQNGSSKE